MKLSQNQKIVLDLLKNNNKILYFKGIGTRYKPSCDIINEDGGTVQTCNISTFKKLRDFGLLDLVKKESHHSTYKLKEDTGDSFFEKWDKTIKKINL